MSRFLKVFFVFYFLVCLQSVYPQQLPQWRGPRGTGAALSGNPPIEWSEKKNIKWKIRLPGTQYGNISSPVIVDNQIYFRGHKYLYCISH